MNYRHIQVDPVTPAIGAMISGVDLNQVRSEDVYEEIQQALWQHGVVFFRKQPLTPEAHVRLARQFGDVEKHEFFPHIKGHPEVQLIAHEGHESPETDRWHADVTFRKQPSLVCALRITDLPPSGGDTMWASAAAAFDALDPALKHLLLGLQAEHDMPFHFRRINAYEKLAKRDALSAKAQGTGSMISTMASAAEMDAAMADRECKMIKDNPSVVHPAVITHPFNGRNLLYVNSIWTKRLLGVHMDLSEALLHMLAEWMKKPEFMVRFRWEKDSLVLWDNCQTQHYAVFDYAPHYRAGHRVAAGKFTPVQGAQPALAAAPEARDGDGLRRVLDTARLQGATAQEKAAVDALFSALDAVDLNGLAARASTR